jgi:hypothetical protein
MSFSWKKLGMIFDPVQHANRPDWMVSFAQAPNVIVLDDVVRLFFCCRPAPDANAQYVSLCAYVDLNRKDLSEVVRIADKPVLELGSLGMFDEFGTYPVSVARDGNRLVAVYGGWTRCESVPFNISLGIAWSEDDGATFKKLGAGPILSATPDEPFVITSPKIRRIGDEWILGYTAGMRWILDEAGKPEIIYKLRIASSPDGVNWSKLNKDIVESRLGVDEAQACPDIHYANGRYHMFFCYREGLDFRTNKLRSYRIGYAVSDDLRNWQRDDGKAGIDASDEGWDSEMVAYPHLFDLDGETYMLYGGNGNGRTGIGLAKLEGELR